MRVSVEEVFETVRMTLDHHFDIRTVTLGVNLKDCMDRNINKLTGRIHKRIVEKGQLLNKFADIIEHKYGIPITNRRISVTPASLLLEPLPRRIETAVRLAKALDTAAKKAEVDFLGGFGAMVQKGMTATDKNLIDAIPQALSRTQRLCGFLNLASTAAGINMDAVEKFGHTLKKLARRTKNGVGCAKIAVFANVPEDNPFMAGAHHGIGEPDFSLNIGISGPGVVRNVVLQNPDCDLTQLAEVIKRTAVKKGGAMASGNIGGLSGTFIPVSEDAGMVRAVKAGTLNLEKLEALTSVCSVGLDMFAVPGDTPAEVLSAIIADELSIGVINNKTTGVRVIPVPGRKPGDIVHFGGLLGSAPVMKVAKTASPKFIARKGRIPSQIQTLRN